MSRTKERRKVGERDCLDDRHAMHLVSVKVGTPRVVRWRGREAATGIFEEPVEGIVPLRRAFDGDAQADLSVHGGAAKAVYAYALGDVAAGDLVERIADDPAEPPVSEITRVYARDRDDRLTIDQLGALDALPDGWRNYFASELHQLQRRSA